MRKSRLPKKGDVVSALGYTGTFEVLRVDPGNRVVDLRSLEKRNVPSRLLEGVPWTTLLQLPEQSTTNPRE
jgi:hypothetical protein